MTKKQATQKIMGLLQSSDQKNRLLAFKFMQSMELHSQIATLIGEKTKLFRFPNTPSGSGKLLIGYQGLFNNLTMNDIVYDLNTTLNYYHLPFKINRKAFSLIMDICVICQHQVKTGFEAETQITFERKIAAFHIEVSWIVNDETRIYIKKTLDGIAPALQNKHTRKKYNTFFYQEIFERTTEGFLAEDWWLMLYMLIKIPYQYNFIPVKDNTFRFSFLTIFSDEDEHRKNNGTAEKPRT